MNEIVGRSDRLNDLTEKPPRSPIATHATPAGRGAICTLLLDGHDILARIEPMFQPATPIPLQATLHMQDSDRQGIVRFGHWKHESDQNSWEEVILTLSEMPSSTLDTDTTTRIELQCHGGNRAVRSILASLDSSGFQILTWQEWLAQTRSEFDCEYAASLANAATQRTALLLLAQVRQADAKPGAIPREIDTIIRLLSGSDTTGKDLNNVTIAIQRLQTLIHYGRIGLHLSAPWQIAVVGEPNVGKSSLVNALVGYQRSIVYNQPGTTRDELETSIALDGWPIQVWDTAGLRETGNEIESQGIARASERLQQSDLILHIRDARYADQTTEDQFQEFINQHGNVLGVWNKIDLLSTNRRNAIHSESASHPVVVETSATQGTGLDTLKNQIVQSLIPDPIDSHTALLFTHRQVALAEQALAIVESGRPTEAADRLAVILHGSIAVTNRQPEC